MNIAFDALRLKQISLNYRQRIIQLANSHTFGIHVGGSLSLAEILSVLYYSVAQVNPDEPEWADRDRIILSKGHGNVGLLTILSMKGFIPEDALTTFNQLGSPYSMHPDDRVPGVEHATGSLGHGLSVSVGIAMAARLDRKNYHVYCILGDGELMEGSIWEAIMSAGHFKLQNLTAIVDRNGLSQENPTEEVMGLEPLADKYHAFGWRVYEVDGHDVSALWEAFNASSNGKPKAIIAKTYKGRGVAAIENLSKSHFAHLNEEQTKAALQIIADEREDLA